MKRVLAAGPAPAVAVLTGCSGDAENADAENADAPAREESTHPGGGSLDLSRAPGVPTLVDLWGSWCLPCREELPLVQEFAQQAGEDVRVVGVTRRDGRALPFTYFLDADGGPAHVQTRPITSVDEPRGLVAEHLGAQL